MKLRIIGSGVVAAAALAVGCKSGPAPEPETARQGPVAGDARMAGDTQEAPRRDTDSPTMGSIHVDERIVRICGDLPDPHFEFDSASIRGRAADSLRAVARCFTDGALRGKSVKLVGRADPRGGEAYNLALGHDRAASVARFLEGAGIPQANIRMMSRGEMDATGTDEAGWARDRRVDIALADEP